MNNHHFARHQIEDAIELLCELFPKTFFVNAGKRRPLKNDIALDLRKEDTGLSPELLEQAVAFYSSAFGYQQQLQAGTKRVDLAGRAVGTVTESEERAAREYVSSRKAAMGERNG